MKNNLQRVRANEHFRNLLKLNRMFSNVNQQPARKFFWSIIGLTIFIGLLVVMAKSAQNQPKIATAATKKLSTQSLHPESVSVSQNSNSSSSSTNIDTSTDSSSSTNSTPSSSNLSPVADSGSGSKSTTTVTVNGKNIPVPTNGTVQVPTNGGSVQVTHSSNSSEVNSNSNFSSESHNSVDVQFQSNNRINVEGDN
jgi:cytoskeletal protein RodZ